MILFLCEVIQFNILNSNVSLGLRNHRQGLLIVRHCGRNVIFSNGMRVLAQGTKLAGLCPLFGAWYEYIRVREVYYANYERNIVPNFGQSIVDANHPPAVILRGRFEWFKAALSTCY